MKIFLTVVLVVILLVACADPKTRDDVLTAVKDTTLFQGAWTVGRLATPSNATLKAVSWTATCKDIKGIIYTVEAWGIYDTITKTGRKDTKLLLFEVLVDTTTWTATTSGEWYDVLALAGYPRQFSLQAP